MQFINGVNRFCMILSLKLQIQVQSAMHTCIYIPPYITVARKQALRVRILDNVNCH